MLNVPFCLIGQPWLEGTSTGASFDLLRHRKRARKVTVRIPQRKVTKFKLKIAPSFQFFLRNPAQKLLQPKTAPPTKTIAYICGLGARIECEPLSEHSTHRDRVTNIGYGLCGGSVYLPAANQSFTKLYKFASRYFLSSSSSL